MSYVFYSNTYNKKAVLAQRLPRDARDRTFRQYTHRLLLESPFVPIAELYGKK